MASKKPDPLPTSMTPQSEINARRPQAGIHLQISVAHGTWAISLADAVNAIAHAVYPAEGPSDQESPSAWIPRLATAKSERTTLLDRIKNGQTKVVDHLTRSSPEFPPEAYPGDVLDQWLIPLSELRDYCKEKGIGIVEQYAEDAPQSLIHHADPKNLTSNAQHATSALIPNSPLDRKHGSPSLSTHQEDAPTRKKRRLNRFKELGGTLQRAGDKWHCRGKRGALKELSDEEQRDSRPMSKRQDVKRDLEAAMAEPSAE